MIKLLPPDPATFTFQDDKLDICHAVGVFIKFPVNSNDIADAEMFVYDPNPVEVMRDQFGYFYSGGDAALHQVYCCFVHPAIMDCNVQLQLIVFSFSVWGHTAPEANHICARHART